MMKHKHRFRYSGHNVKEIHFRCKCGERKSREATDKEKKRIKDDWDKFEKRSAQMHRIAWDFDKRFKTGPDTWKKTGFELMSAVGKWAQKHPTVIETSCDDYCAAGATLVMIPHETRGEYWGTTVYFLQQFGPPAEFFFYPGNHEEVLSALNKIKRRFREPKHRGLKFTMKPT